MSITKRYFEDFYDARVQVALVWNFILEGNASGVDFRPDTDEAKGTFSAIRETNDKFKALTKPEV